PCEHHKQDNAEPQIFEDFIFKLELSLNPGNNNPLPTLYVHISVRSGSSRSSPAGGGYVRQLSSHPPDNHIPRSGSEGFLCCKLCSDSWQAVRAHRTPSPSG